MSTTSKSILRSTGLVGGSQVLSIFFNIIRSKVVALLLGPGGTGFVSTLQSSTMMVQSLAGLGISNSAVRDIAQAHSSGNDEELAKTVRTQRRAIIFTGILGLVLVVSFARPLSQFSFDTDQYTWDIRLLSLAVFFTLMSQGQGSLLQGLRKIKDLSKMTIIGAALGALLSIPLIYWFGMRGVALYLVLVAFGQYVVSYYYSHKVSIQKVYLNWEETLQRTQGMVRLGLAFMGGALAGVITQYLIKVFIIRDINLEAAGLYQAAVAISGLYINVVLQAMGKDFYPRLAAVANKAKEEIKLINEQTEIGIILSAPGLLFTLGLAPLAIKLLYTAEYMGAFPILQWMILGVFMRIISWPLGFLFMGRGKGAYFFYVELITQVLHLVLIFFTVRYFGVKGTGISLFLLYIFYTGIVYFLCRRLNGFEWNGKLKTVMLIVGAMFFIAFITITWLPMVIGSAIVCTLAIGLSYFALKKVMDIMGISSFKELKTLLMNKFRK